MTSNVDAMFEKCTIVQIREAEREKRREIEDKKKEMRETVGARYRDIIKSADSIAEMQTCCRDIAAASTQMEKMCDAVSVAATRGKQSASAALHQGAVAGTRNSTMAVVQSVAHSVNYLLDTPSHIWSCLDDRRHLDGALRFLSAQRVYAELVKQEHPGGQPPSSSSADQHPALSSSSPPSSSSREQQARAACLANVPWVHEHWEQRTNAVFRRELRHSAKLRLRRLGLSCTECAELLVCLMLVTPAGHRAGCTSRGASATQARETIAAVPAFGGFAMCLDLVLRNAKALLAQRMRNAAKLAARTQEPERADPSAAAMAPLRALVCRVSEAIASTLCLVYVLFVQADDDGTQHGAGLLAECHANAVLRANSKSTSARSSSNIAPEGPGRSADQINTASATATTAMAETMAQGRAERGAGPPLQPAIVQAKCTEWLRECASIVSAQHGWSLPARTISHLDELSALIADKADACLSAKQMEINSVQPGLQRSLSWTSIWGAR
mgnify:CR=1 FL=1